MNLLNVTVLGLVFTSSAFLGAIDHKSMTANSIPYREICKNAALDEECFQNFRGMQSYAHALECGQLGEFADYLRLNASSKTLALMPQFRKLDLIGNPACHNMQGFGRFSGTTLRYVIFADLIDNLFDLPTDYTVVEIGAGFGGQAYILSQLLPFSKYYIYDLPEVEMLIEKVASKISTSHLVCQDLNAELPEESVDLFISNYALSECDRTTQLDYIKRVVVKAKRGFMMFNETNNFDHLSLTEWIDTLKGHGIHPRLFQEPVPTYTGNVLITWDRANEY